MGEAFERDEVSVVHQLPDGISEMNDVSQSADLRTTERASCSMDSHRQNTRT